MCQKEQHRFDRVAFYIVAHADDWQLFMQPHAFLDIINPACKVVFIITTAGDAGFSPTFWQAREEGMKSSVRYCLAPYADLQETEAYKEFSGKKIWCWGVNNCRAFFFRLPDGNLDGAGFKANNFASLGKLKREEVPSIHTLDGRATYASFDDLVSALDSLAGCEIQGVGDCSIHYLDPSDIRNEGDHPDHTCTGEAVQLTTVIRGSKQILYRGYKDTGRGGGLEPFHFFWKTGTFAAYEKTVFDLCGYSTLKEDPDLYFRWCNRAAKYIKIPAVSPV